MSRARFEWKVQVVSPRGESSEERVQAFWDPKGVTTSEAVAHAGAMQAWAKAGRPKSSDGMPLSFAGVGVRFVGEVGVKEPAAA